MTTTSTTTRPSAIHAIADHIFNALRGSNNLIFGGSRRTVETLADALRAKSEATAAANEFYPHHGNLSKELREELEKRLKVGELPTTAVCTTTLELGIDIGSVKAIAQIGAPRSISSLRQRLGRTGRREGVPARLRIYVVEPDSTIRATSWTSFGPMWFAPLRRSGSWLEGSLNPPHRVTLSPRRCSIRRCPSSPSAAGKGPTSFSAFSAALVLSLPWPREITWSC